MKARRPEDMYGFPKAGGPWQAATAASIVGAFKAGEVVCVAWHDGWKQVRIVKCVFTGGDGTPYSIKALEIETMDGGRLVVPNRLLKISVLTRVEKAGVPF